MTLIAINQTAKVKGKKHSRACASKENTKYHICSLPLIAQHGLEGTSTLILRIFALIR